MMNVKDDDYILKQATRMNDPEAKAILPSDAGTNYLPINRNERAFKHQKMGPKMSL